MADTKDFRNKNITFTGTDGITVPNGTTLQRTGTTTGKLRYNSDLGFLEQYNATGWAGIDAPPVVTTQTGTINEDTDSTITVTGSNFKSGSSIYITGAGVNNVERALSTTFVNSSTLTANTNASSVAFVGGASYGVKVVNPSGLSSFLDPAGNVDQDPVFTTAAGNVATIYDENGSYSPITTIVANDPDGTGVTFAETTGNLSAAGMTLNSNGTITGNPTNVASSTNVPFTARVTSNGQTTDRSFNIIVNPYPDGSSAGRAITDLTLWQTDIGGSAGSGWYYVQNPNSGTGELAYIDASTDGGGWLEILSVPGWVSQGNFQWANTTFWTGNSTQGSTGGTNHYTTMFKSWAFNYFTNFNEISVQVYNNSGSVIAWGSYDRLSGFNNQSWYTMMNPGSRQVITGTRQRQGGDSGAGHNNPQSTVYGFQFTDTGKPGCGGESMVINDQNQRNSSSDMSQCRISTTQYSDSPTNRGHIVPGGFGVAHGHGGWRGGQAAGPQFDYCTNAGAGQANRAWGNSGSMTDNTNNFIGAGSWAHQSSCYTGSGLHVAYGARIMVRN